ncbi:hypothetical protein [Dokdonia sp. R86516]|uniref:hypothetical protein n=1 Tax=Dokdonia sp. R86516 TaxID=3093856 RepID=UPI0037C63008
MTLLLIAALFITACSSDDETVSTEENNNALQYTKTTITIDEVTSDFQLYEYQNSGRLFKITQYADLGYSTSEAFFEGDNRFPYRIVRSEYNQNQESIIRSDYFIELADNKLVLTDSQSPVVMEILFTGKYIDSELFSVTETGFERETIFTRNSDNNLINQTEGNELDITYSDFDTNHFKDPLGGAVSETNHILYALLDLEESKNTPLTSEAFGVSQTTELIYDGDYVVGYIEYDGSTEILLEHTYE